MRNCYPGLRDKNAGGALRIDRRLRLESLEARLVLSGAGLLITELMASNDSTLADGDGEFSDWIEVHNPESSAVDLSDYFLTDDGGDLEKWPFPPTSLDAGGYLVVFASAPDDGLGGVLDDYVDGGGNYHTNFRLNVGGERLALTYKDPATFDVSIVHEYAPAFPEQRTDISFGIGQGNLPLVDSGDTVHYLVPGDDTLDTTWTDLGFDDAAWEGHVDFNLSTVVITELGIGDTDWIEIQNVSDQIVGTSGWTVAFNNGSGENISREHSFLWDWPDPLTPGQVLATNEDENGLGNIFWGDTGPGWALLIDALGEVRDFVPWGYSEADIGSFNTTINGFDVTAADLPWSGDGVPGADPSTVVLQRMGDSDGDLAGDFVFTDSNNQGSQNPSLSVPFASNPVVTPLGVGYETNPTGGSGQLVDLAPDGAASQSSVAYNGVPQNAIDGDYGNYTHTAAGENLPAWWEIDLGDAFVLEEIVLHNRANCCQSRLRDITVEIRGTDDEVVFTSALLNPENVLGGGGTAGPAQLDLDLIALNGGNPIVGQTVHVTRTPDPDLSGTGGEGSGSEVDVLSLGEVEIFGRDLLSYEQVFQTDLEAAMSGISSSVYLRVPFEMTDDPAGLDQLLLNMQYDDGFIAYLNGTKIAERNAPASPSFDSTATAKRDDAAAIQFEMIDVTSHSGLLHQGDNILAIHGLNLSAGDDDFLITPQLVGITTETAVRFFDMPTPGAPNNDGLIGFVGDTQFNVDRGFYDAEFQLQITSDTPGANIFYSTDGDAPTATTGTLYTNPITIGETTVLRAVATKSGYFASNVDTQTYIFVDDVVRQDYQATLDAGLPTSWGGTSPDYGLDPDVIGNFDANGNSTGGDDYGGIYAATIKDDLKSLPTLSIVMNTDDLFGSNGIYTHSTRHGVAWERPASVEWITDDGAQEFQVDAGLRIHGGAFRSDGLTKKHSFRLLFKDIYGPTKLNFPLFGEGAVDQFNTIVLRAGANDGYAWSSARDTEQYTRDEFGRSLQRAAGSPSPHGNFAHLYLNGIYWGLYNPLERPDNEFSESYISGNADNWDTIHVAETPAGDSSAWNAMFSQTAEAGSSLTDYMELQGLDLDGTPNPSIAPLLNVQNYVDYIALNVWGGNWDWPRKNFWAGRDRDPATTTGFHFFNWDFENTMGNNRGRSPLDATTLDQDFTGSRNAGQPHTNLKSSAEYRMLFADRIHKFFFNDGILTPDALIARYLEITNQVERAMVAESARWGDTHHSTPQTLAEWTDERDWMTNTYLPQRSDVVMQELRNNNLYPSTVAPSFNQHGGQVASGFDLIITAPSGDIYYTLDGSDPRAIGGANNSTAIQYTGSPIEITAGVTVRARVRTGSNWSAVNDADFTVAPPADSTNLRITEINYNPHDANLVPGLNELAVDNDEFEFVELQNISGQTIDLAGVQFVEVPDGGNNEGIAFTFGQQTLDPGEHVLVVENQAAFESRYTLGLNIAGEYSGKLSNTGELITVRDAIGQTISQFEYNDSGNWPGRADGKGASLEAINNEGDFNSATNWRSSNEFGGSPASDGTGPVADVIVNELLSHGVGGEPDLVELYNTTATAIDLDKWYLSDTSSDLFKFQFADGVSIGPGQYLVLSDTELGFGFDGQFGEDIWIVEGDNNTGKPLRFADHLDFDATEADVSLGRWLDGDPLGAFFPMTSQTFGTPNSGPVFGDLLISEVHYNPAEVPPAEQGNISRDELEFVELYNNSGGPLDIGDWKIEGINLAFPAGTVVAAGQTIVVVTFDPDLEPTKATAFRNVFGADGTIQLVGPASGQLNNAGELVKVLRPEDPVLHATGDLLVDAVFYDELEPWPAAADGTGPSLTRTSVDSFAPFAASWTAVDPSPGSTSFASISGDFDADGDVDGDDFLAWQGGFGMTSGAELSDGDGDGDGDVDGDDFLIWQSNFGGSSAGGAVNQGTGGREPGSVLRPRDNDSGNTQQVLRGRLQHYMPKNEPMKRPDAARRIRVEAIDALHTQAEELGLRARRFSLLRELWPDDGIA